MKPHLANQLPKLFDAYLHFADGTSFQGKINRDPKDPSFQAGFWGEAAFSTAMSGYQETITDPSYLGQHIIFTTSHVGNYPSNEQVMQAKTSFASSVIARHFTPNQYLLSLNIPLFSGLDTRALVKYLTSSKSNHSCVITPSEKAPSAQAFKNAKLDCDNLARVSQVAPEVLVPGANPIVLINYGVKQAIVDYLRDMKYPLVSLPYNVSSATVASYRPRLIFLSNGPGDPKNFVDQIKVVRELLDLQVPIRGICLGHQLLGLALGAQTMRLPYGQRGINHPVLDHHSGNIVVTSQNHGYAIEASSFEKVRPAGMNPLKRELVIQYSSLFDRSIEGIASSDRFLRSVQFHPEAHPGPSDALEFFREIQHYLSQRPGEAAKNPLKENHPLPTLTSFAPRKQHRYKKILLIGSGPIKIGQASEFDYSGTQACKSLKQLGFDVILLNSNPATIMTDPEMAYQTYIEPITKDVVKKIVKQEKVEAILSTMGGQTALNICVELAQEGFLEANGVELLGAKVETIRKTEDRQLFADELKTLGYQAGKRFIAHSQAEALTLARDAVAYPLIIRRDFALGGKGSALIFSEAELHEAFTTDLKFPITMEKSLVGYKEVELEVMVDQAQNGVVICSIENVDPCGIHTGDSITVAPAQTISDHCYQQLRTMSLTIAKHMGVVAGGANVQFAINPEDENDIVVIEMNPRVSRSSALASKATGYPIAKISALLAVGYTLTEILNDITKASPVAFEPTLDYVAVKIPIFPFNKFPTSSHILGPQMRSVGEVLALGSSFNEAFMKALRSLEMGLEVPTLEQLKTTPLDIDEEYLRKRLKSPRELSLLTTLEALRKGISPEEIFKLSRISPWFIAQMQTILKAENDLQHEPSLLSDPTHFTHYKSLGFSDKHLALLTNKAQGEILKFRIDHKIFPVYKAVDTCSGEFEARTPYFYSTYQEQNEAQPLSLQGRAIAILGSGPNRIGQGIEFDYSCVKSCASLKTKGIQSIMINSNPETVSTDYDSSDRLYLSPLYSEDIFDILWHERPEGVITCFSGQTGIKLREHIEQSFRQEFAQFNFLGPSLETLRLTEDRGLFYQVTQKVDLSHTHSKEVRGHKQLITAMTDIGLPVIIRPSFVIGGESMYIFYHHDDIKKLPLPLQEQLKHSTTNFQVENYLEDALEYDVDLIRDQRGHTIFTVCEHIEHAGVHSGDSGMFSPSVVLKPELYQKLKRISIALGNELQVVGPINFQFAIKDDKIYCIEANPRGSRTLPFLSKSYAIDLPALATQAMLGEDIPNWDNPTSKFYCVKQSTFPFDRFVQDNVILGPKMRSTGETFGMDENRHMAVLKSYMGNYPMLDQRGHILMSLADHSKHIMKPYLKPLYDLGYRFFATQKTSEFIQSQGVACTTVAKLSESGGQPMIEALKDEKLRMVFNTPMDLGSSKSDGEFIRNNAIQYGVPCFTRAENIIAVVEAIIGTGNTPLVPKAINLISAQGGL